MPAHVPRHPRAGTAQQGRTDGRAGAARCCSGQDRQPDGMDLRCAAAGARVQPFTYRISRAPSGRFRFTAAAGRPIGPGVLPRGPGADRLHTCQVMGTRRSTGEQLASRRPRCALRAEGDGGGADQKVQGPASRRSLMADDASRAGPLLRPRSPIWHGGCSVLRWLRRGGMRGRVPRPAGLDAQVVRCKRRRLRGRRTVHPGRRPPLARVEGGGCPAFQRGSLISRVVSGTEQV